MGLSLGGPGGGVTPCEVLESGATAATMEASGELARLRDHFATLEAQNVRVTAQVNQPPSARSSPISFDA